MDSDCTDEKASVRIDVTIMSTGKWTVVPPVTVGVRYLFRCSRRLSRFSLFDGAHRAEIVGFRLAKETVCTRCAICTNWTPTALMQRCQF